MGEGRTFRQDSFAKGEIGPLARGKLNSEYFGRGVSHLENWDVLDQETLKVRGGLILEETLPKTSEAYTPHVGEATGELLDYAEAGVGEIAVSIYLFRFNPFNTTINGPILLRYLVAVRERVAGSIEENAEYGARHGFSIVNSTVFLADRPNIQNARLVKAGPGRHVLLVGGLPFFKVREIGGSGFLGILPHGYTDSQGNGVISPSDYPMPYFSFQEDTIKLGQVPQIYILRETNNKKTLFTPDIALAFDSASTGRYISAAELGYPSGVSEIQVKTVGLTSYLSLRTDLGEEFSRSFTFSVLRKLSGEFGTLEQYKEDRGIIVSSPDTDTTYLRESASEMPLENALFINRALDDTQEPPPPTNTYGNRQGGPQYSFPIYVPASIPRSILDRVQYLSKAGGPLMMRLLLIDGSTRDLFCWVYRYEQGFRGEYNCFICFSFRGPANLGETDAEMARGLDKDRGVVGVGHPMYYYSFHSIDEALDNLTAQLQTYLYSVPAWNASEGHPRSAYSEGGRLFLTGGGPGNSKVAHSAPAPQSIFKFNNYIPNLPRVEKLANSGIYDGVIWDSTAIKAVRDAGPGGLRQRLADTFIPASNEGEEAIYWYFVQLLGESGVSSNVGDFDVGDDDSVHWVSGVRDLIVGTSRGEIRVPVNENLEQVFGSRGVQSFRGSSSSLVERGDYAIFFIAENGKDIYNMYYDDGVAGFRSELATLTAPEFDSKVRDMTWDYTLRCLWVMLESGKLFKYFLSKEYEIAAWSRFTTNLGYFNPRHFVRRRGRLGIISEGEDAFSVYTVGGDETLADGDFLVTGIPSDRGAEIRSRVDLFKVAPPGKQGVSSLYKKRVSFTEMDTYNCSELDVDGERHIPENGIVFLDRGTDEVSRLPVIRVEHTAPEKAVLRASDSKMIIHER